MPLCSLFRTFSHPHVPLHSAHTAMEVASYRRIAHPRILLFANTTLFSHPHVPLSSAHTAMEIASYRRNAHPRILLFANTTLFGVYGY